MHQNQLIAILQKLYPEMQKRAAADVMIDYANANDLSPAILERLGQAFNTHRTLTHLKSASTDARGESVPMVDIPEMISRFSQGDDQAPTPVKAAATHTHDVDLRTAFLSQFEAPVEKAASAEPEVVEETFKVGEILEEARNLSAAARVSAIKQAGELSRSLPRDSKGRIDLYATEEHALHQVDRSHIDRAVELIEKVASVRSKVEITRFDGELVKRAHEVDTAASQALIKLANTLVEYEIFEKVATAEEPDEKKEVKPEHIQDMTRDNAGGSNLDQARPFSQSDDDDDDDDLEQQPTDPQQPRPRISGGEGETRSGEGQDRKTRQSKGEPQSTGAPAAPTPPGNPVKSVVSMIGKLKKPYDGAKKSIVGASNSARQAISRATGERVNKDQMATDMAVEDIKRLVRVKRLIGTDPVLREIDPRKVLEVYNAISETNPSIASNPERLRLALREAATYEGLTLDSQSTLTNVRKGTADASKTEDETNRRRYTINPGK